MMANSKIVPNRKMMRSALQITNLENRGAVKTQEKQYQTKVVKISLISQKNRQKKKKRTNLILNKTLNHKKNSTN
jgi:hypothetical protein